LIEPELAVAADVRDDRIEIVQHHAYLGELAPCIWTVGLFDRYPTADAISPKKCFRSGALPSDVIGM
jgi:hypothetical protein